MSSSSELSKSTLTLAYLLKQQDEMHKLVTEKFKSIINDVSEPIINVLKLEYSEKTGEELSIEKVNILIEKLNNSYYGYSLIETCDDNKYQNLVFKTKQNYIIYCINPERIKNGVERDWYPFTESMKNPEFAKYQNYYESINDSGEIDIKLEEILRHYHEYHQEILKIYNNYMKIGEKICGGISETDILNDLNSMERT